MTLLYLHDHYAWSECGRKSVSGRRSRCRRSGSWRAGRGRGRDGTSPYTSHSRQRRRSRRKSTPPGSPPRLQSPWWSLVVATNGGEQNYRQGRVKVRAQFCMLSRPGDSIRSGKRLTHSVLEGLAKGAAGGAVSIARLDRNAFPRVHKGLARNRGGKREEGQQRRRFLTLAHVRNLRPHAPLRGTCRGECACMCVCACACHLSYTSILSARYNPPKRCATTAGQRPSRKWKKKKNKKQNPKPKRTRSGVVIKEGSDACYHIN